MGGRTISHVGWGRWSSPMLLILLLLLLLILRGPATILIASSEVPSASASTVIVIVVVVVVVVAGSLVVVIVVVVIHSHASSVHVVTPTVSATTTGGRWNESGPDPFPNTRLFVVIKGDPGALVGVLLPPVRKRRNHLIVLAPGTDVPLLCRGQSHSALLPFRDMFLVVKLEVLTEFPSPALLFATGGTVVCQIRVGVIVEKAGHGESILLFVR